MLSRVMICFRNLRRPLVIRNVEKSEVLVSLSNIHTIEKTNKNELTFYFRHSYDGLDNVRQRISSSKDTEEILEIIKLVHLADMPCILTIDTDSGSTSVDY